MAHEAPASPDTLRLTCPDCGHLLGLRHVLPAGNLDEIKKGKKRWVGISLAIECDECGGTWQGAQLPDQADLLAAALRTLHPGINGNGGH